jgi:two-component system NtrC family sensor kinase
VKTTKLWNRLSVRLIFSISIVLVIILTIYTYISITHLDSYLTRISFNNANNFSDLIKKSTRYSMLLNRREDVHQIIKTIGTEKGVKGIRIYNKQGTIIFSTDTMEISKNVDVTAEACIVCHNSSAPLSTLTSQDKMRIFRAPDKNRVLGLINPIHNERDCSSADCHAHSPKIQILGVLDVMVSLSELDSIKSETAKNTIINSAVITIIIGLTCGIFILLLVNAPMKKLFKGIEELGKGNLDYKISVKSKDELGVMAVRFNEMSGKLDSAYKEIKEWSENLNVRIHEKTEELKNIYNQVLQIEKLASLGKLSATVAHELNNPLEGILTYSKLIAKKLREISPNGENLPNGQSLQKLLTYLDLISSESSRCGKIVKDLLLFSHQEDNEFSRVDLIPVIDKSIALINHHLEINNIKLVREYCVQSLLIYCNPQKIQQALMALLINSIEAMNHGGKIAVRLNLQDKYLLLRVIDEGSGISQKDLPHIFEPFYSTKESHAARAKGTGLGLAVVYGIITQHNGKVEVEKTSSSGTTFLVTLPINNYSGS